MGQARYYFEVERGHAAEIAQTVLRGGLVPAPLPLRPPPGARFTCELAVRGMHATVLLDAECTGVETPEGILLNLEPAAELHRGLLIALAELDAPLLDEPRTTRRTDAPVTPRAAHAEIPTLWSLFDDSFMGSLSETSPRAIDEVTIDKACTAITRLDRRLSPSIVDEDTLTTRRPSLAPLSTTKPFPIDMMPILEEQPMTDLLPALEPPSAVQPLPSLEPSLPLEAAREPLATVKLPSSDMPPPAPIPPPRARERWRSALLKAWPTPPPMPRRTYRILLAALATATLLWVAVVAGITFYRPPLLTAQRFVDDAGFASDAAPPAATDKVAPVHATQPAARTPTPVTITTPPVAVTPPATERPRHARPAPATTASAVAQAPAPPAETAAPVAETRAPPRAPAPFPSKPPSEAPGRSAVAVAHEYRPAAL
jgi:hypothetical protein